MNKQQAPLFTWVGSGDPGDPSGVARFVVGCESVTVAMRSFKEAYSLSRLIEKACDRTKQQTIDWAIASVSNLLNMHRHD